MREGKLNFWRKKSLGVSANKSWEKSIHFRYGSSEDFCVCKGQQTREGGRGGLDFIVLIGLKSDFNFSIPEGSGPTIDSYDALQ